jgi:hypothetical protein
MMNEPMKLKPTKSKKNQPTNAALPPSISSTSTIESHYFGQYLIEDFLYTNVGNSLLLQIALGGSPYFLLLIQPLQKIS